MVKPWTVRQEEVLRENAYRGAEAAALAIFAECGVRRSAHAVEMHASRIHVSLRKLETCPECGAAGVRLMRVSGMCQLCTERQHVAEERAFAELLAAEAAGCEAGPELEAARREYARLRQANSRMRRRYGLAGKRGRD